MALVPYRNTARTCPSFLSTISHNIHHQTFKTFEDVLDHLSADIICFRGTVRPFRPTNERNVPPFEQK